MDNVKTSSKKKDVIRNLAKEFSFVALTNAAENAVEFISVSDEVKAIFDATEGISPEYRRYDAFMKRLIHPDDFDAFLKNVNREKAFEAIIETGSFSTDFRAIIDGEVHYFRLRMRTDAENPAAVISGLINIDDIKAREDASAKLVAELNETKEQKSKADVLASLSGDYELVFLVNIDTDELLLVRVDENYKRYVDSVDEIASYSYLYNNMVRSAIDDDKEYVASRFDLERIWNATETSGSVYGSYTIKDRDGKLVHFRVKNTRSDRPGRCIIMAFHDTVPEDKSILSEKRDAAVINDLTADYESVCYIQLGNVKSEDQSVQYRCSDLFARLMPEWKQQMTWTERIEILRARVVHPDDRDSFLATTKREIIIENLKRDPAFFVNFRTLINGQVKYYQIKYTADKSGPFCRENGIVGLVVGIHSIDTQTKSEIKMRKEIEKRIADQTAELSDKNRALSRVTQSIIELLGDLVESRDAESGEHIQRVKGFVYILASQMMRDYPELGLTEDKINLMTVASALHDIGKIGVPDAILLKPGKLTPLEFEIMKTHCVKGYEILQKISGNWNDDYMDMAKDICRYHHEKVDGGGYPFGLKGEEIPLSAQIVSLVDAYDALTSKRCYKEAFSYQKSYDMIMDGECGAFSGRLLNSFRRARGWMEAHAANPTEFLSVDMEFESHIVLRSESQQDELHKCINILNEETDATTAIQLMLQSLSDYHDADRAYLFELEDDPNFIRLSFEYCRPGVMSLKNDMMHAPVAQRESWFEGFNRFGSFKIASLKEEYSEDTDAYKILKPQAVNSLITVPIIENDNFIGFIGVDNPGRHVDDVLVMKTVASLARGEIIKRLQIVESGHVLEDLTVLVADDDEHSRELDKELLEAAGARVIDVENGKLAVEAFKGDVHFDMVLMDIVMPEMNGIAAVSMIRRLEDRDETPIPVIAISADNDSGKVDAMLRAGANAWISKPLKIEELSKAYISCIKASSVDMEKRLKYTIKLANTDPLTRVKNMTAYSEKIASFSAQLKSDKVPEFAIVMCDVNDLKVENDTFGHNVGDIYLKNCSKILTGVFKHSQIYRIGGDEFAVVVEGQDLKYFDSLLDELTGIVDKTSAILDSRKGKASFAFGSAIYDPSMDVFVSDVVKRADEAMYAAKAKMKKKN